MRPFLFWRRFPVRFECRRTLTWITDDTWIADDEAFLPGGRVERRRRFCQLAGDRIRVSSADLPDGADAIFGDDGYRIWPYRILVPIGPVPLPLSVRDQHRA